MRKNGNTRSKAIRASDGAVICLCLLGAAAFLVLFYGDLNRSLHRLNEEPVGFIASKSRAALRRFQDRIVWDRLRKESPVYNGDFIRTADRSEAAVGFPGGELIGISENSLIRVFVDEGVPRIDFSRGNISVYAGEGETLVSFGGNQVKASAGAVVSLDAGPGEGGTFNLQVIRGSASLVTPAEEREAEAGTALTLNAGGIDSGESGSPPRVAVLEPPPAVRVLTPADAAAPVEFIWNGPTGSGEEPIRIEIARDRNFTHPRTVWKEDSPETAGDVSRIAEIPPGTWWWRISSPKDAGGTARARGRLTVVHVPPPEPVSPAPDAAYYYQTELPELRFQWTSSEEVLYYLFEAADNPGMTGPALRTEVRYNSLVYSRLTEGRWYWRVTPVFSAAYRGTAPASPVVTFTITRGDPPRPVQTPGEAPSLETAAAGKTDQPVPPPGTALSAVAEPPPPAAPPPPSGAVAAAPAARPSSPRPESAGDGFPFPAVTGRQPVSGYVINPGTLGESRAIAFNWDPVEGADSYIFTLLQETAAGTRRSIVVSEGPETSYTLEDLSLLDLGGFVWQVEAVSRGTDGHIQRRGTPGENRFIVDIPQPGMPQARDPGALYGR